MISAYDQLESVATRGFNTKVHVAVGDVTEVLIAARQTTPSDIPVQHTIHVQKLRVVITTGFATTWTIQDSNGTPVLLTAALDVSVAGTVFEQDFGPSGASLTLNKDLKVSIGGAGAVGDIYIQGYQEPYMAANNGIPTVVSVSPASGVQAGGTAVAIFGTGFRNHATVTIGGVALTSVQYISHQEILGVTGAHAAGAVNTIVTNPAPNGSETATGAGSFTYV
jgi:hypothetical protein